MTPLKDKIVRTHMDLSTAHITKHDMELLEIDPNGDDEDAVPHMPYEYGAIVFIMGHGEPVEDQDALLDEIRRTGYSPAFCNLYSMAWDLNADMIRLDRDGLVFDELPTFEW